MCRPFPLLRRLRIGHPARQGGTETGTALQNMRDAPLILNRACPAPDQIDRNRTLRIAGQHLMPRSGAEMRQVDGGHRVGGAQAQHGTTPLANPAPLRAIRKPRAQVHGNVTP